VAQDEGSRIAEAFFTASRSGDIAGLRALLAQNVVVKSDGGGKVHAFLNPIVGLQAVLRLYEGLTRKLGVKDGGFYKPVRIDGLPGYVSYERDNVLQTTAFEIEDGKITTVYITRNPDKLDHVVAFALPDSPYLIIAFEDMYGGGDRDYNDVIFALDIGRANIQNLISTPEPQTWAILAGFLGTINPSTGDSGVLVPLEHAMLAQNVADEERTRTFARYSLIGRTCAAEGSLAAPIPHLPTPLRIERAGAFGGAV